MAELIDIYDASLHSIGRMDRTKAHRTGQWHRTFHCWLVDTARSLILFQVRAFDNALHPGKLDVSASGHLLAGETINEGVREIREELGLEVDFSDLVFAGERAAAVDHLGDRIREYQSVFFLPTTIDLESLRPDPAEVAGLVALPIGDGLDLLAGRLVALTVDGATVGEDRRPAPTRQRVVLDDFAPNASFYYLAAAICAERICEGRRDVAIS